MISHHHKCVFVHIPKCGGQSIERLFLDDLRLEWEQRAPLLLRQRTHGEIAPPRLAHLTAEQYVTYKYMPQAMFEEYFCFALVRDPFTRTVSQYKYLALDRVMTFERYVFGFLTDVVTKSSHPWHWFLRPEADFLTDQSGQLLVRHIVKLEDVDTDLPPTLAQVGLKVPIVPHVNSTRTQQRQAAKVRVLYAARERKMPTLTRNEAVWTDSLRVRVTELYEEDFDLLKYPRHLPHS